MEVLNINHKLHKKKKAKLSKDRDGVNKYVGKNIEKVKNFQNNHFFNSKDNQTIKTLKHTESHEFKKDSLLNVKKKMKRDWQDKNQTNQVMKLSENLDTVTKKSKKSRKKRSKVAELDVVEAPSQTTNFVEELQTTSETCDKPTTKNKGFRPSKKDSKDEYVPGSISDMIQIKKYGQVIIPWDPSFGLDTKKSVTSPKIEQENESLNLPKLKVHPLFDLSKRNVEKTDTSSTGLIENTRNRVFVGNLPSETKGSHLKKLFKKCGLIYQVKIRQNNAIIDFKELKSIEAALKFNGKLYKNNHLRVDLMENKRCFSSGHSIFVGNIPFKAQDDNLWNTFLECGEIESVRIVRSQFGKSSGYGFVNFKAVESVKKALKLDGTKMLDREIRVTDNKERAFSLSNSETVKKKRFKKKKKKSELKDNQSFKTENSEKESKIELSESVKKNKKKQKTKVEVGIQGCESSVESAVEPVKKFNKLDKNEGLNEDMNVSDYSGRAYSLTDNKITKKKRNKCKLKDKLNFINERYEIEHTTDLDKPVKSHKKKRKSVEVHTEENENSNNLVKKKKRHSRSKDMSIESTYS